MGFDPYRKQRRGTGDYVAFVVALATVAALLVWAVRG
jgi:hypothetical protein